MKMKKALAVLMAGAMCSGMMAGCGNSPQQDSSGSQAADTTTVRMIIPQYTEYISQLVKEAKTASEAAGYQFVAYDAGGDPGAQIDLINMSADAGAGAMIVLPSSSDQTQDIIDAAGESKVVLFNRALNDDSLLDDSHVYIGPDEDISGTYEGEILADYLRAQNKTEINALLLEGPQEFKHSAKRTEGVKAALENAGITVNYTEIAGAEDYEYTQQEIVSHYNEVNFDAIIANNDAMALGAIAGFVQLGLDISEIPIVGIDGTSAAVTAVRDGSMCGTVYQDVVQADMAVNACINLMEGSEYNKDLDGTADQTNEFAMYTGWAKVTPETVDSYK